MSMLDHPRPNLAKFYYLRIDDVVANTLFDTLTLYCQVDGVLSQPDVVDADGGSQINPETKADAMWRGPQES